MAVKYAGVDLSYANANVDYRELKAGTINGFKVKFAMLRLGHGTSKDKLFDRHYKGCKEAGIHVGVYHWTYATNLTEAREEKVELPPFRINNLHVVQGQKTAFADERLQAADFSGMTG